MIFRKMSSHEAQLQRSFSNAKRGQGKLQEQRGPLAKINFHSPISLLSAFVFRPCFRLLFARFAPHTQSHCGPLVGSVAAEKSPPVSGKCRKRMANNSGRAGIAFLSCQIANLSILFLTNAGT